MVGRSAAAFEATSAEAASRRACPSPTRWLVASARIDGVSRRSRRMAAGCWAGAAGRAPAAAGDDQRPRKAPTQESRLHAAPVTRVVTTRSMNTSSSEAGIARRLVTWTPACPNAADRSRSARSEAPLRHPDVQTFAERLDIADAGQAAHAGVHQRRGFGEHFDDGVRKRRAHLRRLVDGQHAAVAHERDARAALGLVQVGRGHEDRDALRQELGEQPPEFPARHRVDAGGRLVEQDHGGLVHERAGQRELLLHAARQPVGQAAAERRQLHHLEQTVAALPVVGARRESRRRRRCSRRW